MGRRRLAISTCFPRSGQLEIAQKVVEDGGVQVWRDEIKFGPTRSACELKCVAWRQMRRGERKTMVPPGIRTRCHSNCN